MDSFDFTWDKKALVEDEPVKNVITEVKEESKSIANTKAIRDIKKEEINKFNSSKEAKAYGVELIDRKLLLGIFAVLIVTLFAVNIIWSNSNIAKIADKESIIQNDNNIYNNFTDSGTTENNYEHTITNEYTIINNITMSLPDELIIKLSNSSN